MHEVVGEKVLRYVIQERLSALSIFESWNKNLKKRLHYVTLERLNAFNNLNYEIKHSDDLCA